MNLTIQKPTTAIANQVNRNSRMKLRGLAAVPEMEGNCLVNKSAHQQILVRSYKETG